MIGGNDEDRLMDKRIGGADGDVEGWLERCDRTEFLRKMEWFEISIGTVSVLVESLSDALEGLAQWSEDAPVRIAREEIPAVDAALRGVFIILGRRLVEEAVGCVREFRETAQEVLRSIVCAAGDPVSRSV